MTLSSTRFIPALAAGLLVSAAAFAGPPTPSVDANSICSNELKTEVLANLWKRPSAKKSTDKPATVRLNYRNDYGRSARALLFAVDGVAVKLTCEVPEGAGEVFVGPLEPGAHYFDVVFNFGSGRVGRSPHLFKVKHGVQIGLTVVLDRDDHEQPQAHVESK